MPLIEVLIHKRPVYSLKSWYAYDVNGVLGVTGFWRNQRCYTDTFQYFDSERQLIVDALGAVWHLPPDQAARREDRDGDTTDLTEQMLTLYRQPRFIRQPAALVIADDCPELRKLLSTGNTK